MRAYDMFSPSQGGLTTFILQLLKEKIEIITDLKSKGKIEFEKLINELDELQSYVVDSSDIIDKTEGLKSKLREVQELVFDTEDVVETCLTKKTKAKKKNFVHRRYKKLRWDMERKVRRLREMRVMPAIQSMKQYGGENPRGKEVQFFTIYFELKLNE